MPGRPARNAACIYDSLHPLIHTRKSRWCRVGSLDRWSVGGERTRTRHTWLDLPAYHHPTPPPSHSSRRLSPYLPLYLYTCHGRASCTDVEIHASLNNPGPTLIRIFTRRNNIRPAVPRDILRKDPFSLSLSLSRLDNPPSLFPSRFLLLTRVDSSSAGNSFSLLLASSFFSLLLLLVSSSLSFFFFFFHSSRPLICYCTREPPRRGEITRTRGIMFYLCVSCRITSCSRLEI